MADKKLKIVSSNNTFFGRVSSTLRNMLIPTRVGINNFFINVKRSNYIKTYRQLEKIKETNNVNKREELEKKLKETYEEYLESIDKYLMDSVYVKANTGRATIVEKKALSDYYKITTYKNDQYDEYRYRKQLFLLELDYEMQKEKQKRIDPRYEELYAHKCTEIYRNLLKNYSIRLIDNTSRNEVVKTDVFIAIFRLLDKYVKEILPHEIKYSKTNKYNSIMQQYDIYKSYTGKLDERDNLEKKILLLTLSRTLFTHSLPLGTVEECYNKLLKDTRILMVRKIGTKKEDKIFEMIKLLTEEFNAKILSGKIYWEDKQEKNQNMRFWNAYKQAKSEKEKEILLCKDEIRQLKKDKNNTLKNKKIYKYYIDRLRDKYDTLLITGYNKELSNKKYVRYVEKEVMNTA